MVNVFLRPRLPSDGLPVSTRCRHKNKTEVVGTGQTKCNCVSAKFSICKTIDSDVIDLPWYIVLRKLSFQGMQCRNINNNQVEVETHIETLMFT